MGDELTKTFEKYFLVLNLCLANLTLGSVALSELFLQQFVEYLYKAETLSCGRST